LWWWRRLAAERVGTIKLGIYAVIVPAILEICMYSETFEEARGMAGDAIRCYLESALETGESIPSDVRETQ